MRRAASVCLPACLFVRLSPSVCLPACLPACLPVQDKLDMHSYTDCYNRQGQQQIILQSHRFTTY